MVVWKKRTEAEATPDGSLMAAETVEVVGVQPLGWVTLIGSGDSETDLIEGPAASEGGASVAVGVGGRTKIGGAGSKGGTAATVAVGVGAEAARWPSRGSGRPWMRKP